MTHLSVDSPTSLVAGLPTPELSDDEAVDLVLGNAKAQPTITLDSPVPVSYERKLGDSELSYYLPGRAAGVNDMYLHLGFKSPERVMVWHRVRAAWAILRMRHPLLASKVVMRDYDDVKFVYSPPLSPEQALAEAGSQLEYRHQTKDDLIESYLNGPRTLSNERLSYLVVSRTPTKLPTPPSTPRTSEVMPIWPSECLMDEGNAVDYELFICAAHSIGDGMAVNLFANDFFGLLGSSCSQEALEQLVIDEWNQRWGRAFPADIPAFPASVEENLGTDQSRFRRVVGRIDFQNCMDKQIGGQAFPQRSNPVRRSVVSTTSFDEKQTKAMLKACKAHGVSISSALFAICNIAWARMSPREKQELPMMMYAAMNIRPYLPKPVHDYCFLAVGYFNVILPNFMPASCDVSKTFWHRARKAKEQSSRAADRRMIQSRNREMAIKRGEQSRAWAKEDDEKAAGVYISPAPRSTSDKPRASPRSPSVALLGLSLLGNLDGIYKRAHFPDIELNALTIGCRQRNSGKLLFGYTFAGKLWISFGYDENGFDPGTIDLFWANVNAAVHELLVR